MTVRDLIRRSLMLIGVLGEGETASAEMQRDAFDSLKEMLESWSIESLNIPVLTREEFDLIPGQGIYTIGTGGDFNTSRPVMIEACAVKYEDTELSVKLMAPSEWIAESTKSLTSSIPTDIYFDAQAALGKIHVYPVPTEVHKLVLYAHKPIGAFAAVSDTISFPPGYSRAIRYNLAIDLADEYERPVSQGVAMIAAKSLGLIKRQNSKPRYLIPDMTVMPAGRMNILTGE